MRPNRFYDVIQIGPVRVGTFNNGRGQTPHRRLHRPGCGFSTEHRDRSAAELAARTHRCTPDQEGCPVQFPDAQLRAGHIPADIYRQIPPGTETHKVVIVQQAPRSYKGPIVLTLLVIAGSVAVLLVIAFVAQVVAGAAVSVLSATGGLSYTINRAKSHRLK
ncbi:hypothetical protein E4K10_14865 [Streptomyces sp. T1317-0309]|nr:hypothetical protein E4K10_14865 [Streptomyces sp. T1317-0309]